MQWRVLTLVLCGLVVMYITSLMQETSYPHPYSIYTSDPTRWRHKPDSMLLSTAAGYLYLTLFYYEAAPEGREGFRNGVGPMKTGVVGRIIQLRKPLHVLTEKAGNVSEDNVWVQTFSHELPGAISKISDASSTTESKILQFGVMYHKIQDEVARHYIRIYYLREDEHRGMPVFEYKDVRMPGTTFIDAFTLEADSILYSRDPDRYRFRIVALPANLTLPPHSREAEEIVITRGEAGDSIKSYHQPVGTESHKSMICKVFSPVKETYRVLSLDVYKTEDAFYVNITFADNATSTTELSELRQESKWKVKRQTQRQRHMYIEGPMEYVGFADVTQYQQEQKVNMPSAVFARSLQSKTVVLPLIQNRFLTLDYLKRAGDGETDTGYYDWLENEIHGAYDVDILGLQTDDEGDLLALWTEYNVIYIYKRGLADANRKSTQTSSLLDVLRYWLHSRVQKAIGEEKHGWARQELGIPLDWRLCMVITPAEGRLGTSAISALKFWSSSGGEGTRKNHYLFVALRNGGVNSYLVDGVEGHQDGNFLSYANVRWDMLTAMSFVVAMFAFNEYYHHRT